MKPPKRNLGPMAEPWGDWSEAQTLQNAQAIENLGGDSTNDGRINNSTMDLMASQITELYARSSAFVTAADLTTPSFTDAIVSASRTIQLPRPSRKRMAWISVTGYPTQASAVDTAFFVTMSLDGVPFYRTSTALPAGMVTPAGWLNASMTGYTAFVASPASGGSVEILLQARGYFGGAAHTTTLAGIQASINFGQPVA